METKDNIHQTILDCMKEAVYVRDLDMNVLYINKVAASITGFSIEEVVGKKCYEFFGDDGQRCRRVCPVEKAIHDGKHLIHEEGQLKDRQGDLKSMRVSISPLRKDDVKTGAVVLLEDITYLNECKEAHVKTAIKLRNEMKLRMNIEKALGESNELLNNLLSISPMAMGLVENDRFVWVNETMSKLFGTEDRFHFKESLFESIFPSTKDFKKLMKDFRENPLNRENYESDVLLKKVDGSDFDGQLKMKYFSSSETDTRVIFTLADISKRILAEEEKRRKEKLRGVLQLAGAMCHEFNQPLQAITGYIDLLREDNSIVDPDHKFLKIISDQVDRMVQLTDQLMLITKVKTMDYLDGEIIDINKSASLIE